MEEAIRLLVDETNLMIFVASEVSSHTECFLSFPVFEETISEDDEFFADSVHFDFKGVLGGGEFSIGVPIH